MFTGVVESEVQESTEVHDGAAVREPDLVAGDAAVADFAVGAAHEPRDRSFNERSMLTVCLDELGGEGVSTGAGEEVVVFVKFEGLASRGAGASVA